MKQIIHSIETRLLFSGPLCSCCLESEPICGRLEQDPLEPELEPLELEYIEPEHIEPDQHHSIIEPRSIKISHTKILLTQASANIENTVEPSSSRMPNSKMVTNAAASMTCASQLLAPLSDAPNAVTSVM